MDRFAFNAAAAISQQTLARQATANELANVSTPGFKRSYEIAMRAIQAEGAGLETRVQPQAVSLDQVKMLRPGPFMATGRDLDVALSNQTVLGVTAPDGKLAFTRRGDLRISPQGVMETGSGHAVRSQAGGPLTVPAGAIIRIAEDGTVYAKAQGGGNTPDLVVGQMLLRDAANTFLKRREDGLFQDASSPGGDITTGTQPPRLISGTLEGSNVNAMEIMVKLMDQSRSFEQQVRIIKEAKDGDDAGASMMKLST